MAWASGRPPASPGTYLSLVTRHSSFDEVAAAEGVLAAGPAAHGLLVAVGDHAGAGALELADVAPRLAVEGGDLVVAPGEVEEGQELVEVGQGGAGGGEQVGQVGGGALGFAVALEVVARVLAGGARGIERHGEAVGDELALAGLERPGVGVDRLAPAAPALGLRGALRLGLQGAFAGGDALALAG